jgi:hypothetical protein
MAKINIFTYNDFEHKVYFLLPITFDLLNELNAITYATKNCDGPLRKTNFLRYQEAKDKAIPVQPLRVPGG